MARNSNRPQAASHLQSHFSYLSLLGFYLLLLSITYALHEGQFTRNLDTLLHDGWVRLQQREAPEDVVVIGIDSASLASIGRWPWSRDLQAAFFQKLASLEVRAAVIDILYVEPDNFPANDVALAKAIASLPVSILPVLTEGRGSYTDQAEKLPLPVITRDITDLGHIFLPIDADGIVRRVNLMAGFRSAHWPALSLATFNALSAGTGDELIADNIPGRQLEPSPLNTWVEDREVLIPFYGPARTFVNIPIEDVISGRVDPNALAGKIVFIGTTATGMGDVLPTAVSSIDTPMPGVEIHANIFSALRDGSLITEINHHLNFVVAAVLLFFILLLYSRLSPLWGLIGAGVFAMIPILLSYFLYAVYKLWYPPLVASLPMLVSYFIWSWHRLDFVSEFLRQESDKLSREIGSIDNTNDVLLVNFFENAQQHLPVNSWHFEAAGQEFSNGKAIPGRKLEPGLELWINDEGTYRKRYATPGNLTIAFHSDDAEFAEEFASYIDSLSRVRERQAPARMSGSIERLQVNTYRLSSQMERLRQLNGLSESIFEGSSAGLVVWSAAGETVRINELAQQVLPMVLDKEISLHDFLKRIGRDPDSRDQERLQRLILNSESWQINRVQDDNELVINFKAVGDTLAERLISASIVDVSEIRRSERSRAELIDFLSHDLRSPLISSLYLLGDDLRVSEAKNDEKIERIESNINLSLTMMDDLLTLARADNLSAEQFSLSLFDSIVDNAVAQLAPQARNKEIVFEIDPQEDEIWVNADASLLERAVVNIVSNAIKYSPEKTVIKILYRVEGDKIFLDVEDQGIGIAPEMMENLFQRFKRDANISKQFKGIGLGLALVSRVVTQHGGRVWASSPGRGTRISVELPLAVIDDEID